ncbi:MAG: hypothetical protein RLZZ618_2575 [Pseudomonadota bacterium]|jgi:RNA polymerase sigma-70 factor (ECF subfamily)
MDPLTQTFQQLRPRLQGIAYRMLGSVAEAEEVVQDIWLRWHEADHPALDNAEAWLVTVTTRLSIDRLRSAKAQREHYVGMWLPEPVLTEDAPKSPEQRLEHAGNVSVAFLFMLERLTPEARAAFLLRDVLDADYAELARILDKSEAACRQLVHRARAQLAEQPRYAVPPDTHLRLLRGFADAQHEGNFSALKAMLAEGAELIGDGGAKVRNFGRPLLGGPRIAQLFLAGHLRLGDRLRVVPAHINGAWGLLRFVDGVLESVHSVETDGERIVRLHVQRNPDKLTRIATTFAAATLVQR